jgi:hypothetical protein
MANCSIITYRLRRDVHPSQVLAALNDLLSRFGLSYKRCLWSLSNFVDDSPPRRKDSIAQIVQDFPQLRKYDRLISNETRPDVHLLSNFDHQDFASTEPAEEELIRDLLCKIPTAYHVGNLEYYLDGVSFGENCILQENPYGPPRGSYIAYTRESHGDERHSYIILGAVYSGEKHPDLFRSFFLALSNTLPGTYMGTEILFE